MGSWARMAGGQFVARTFFLPLFRVQIRIEEYFLYGRVNSSIASHVALRRVARRLAPISYGSYGGARPSSLSFRAPFVRPPRVSAAVRSRKARAPAAVLLAPRCYGQPSAEAQILGRLARPGRSPPGPRRRTFSIAASRDPPAPPRRGPKGCGVSWHVHPGEPGGGLLLEGAGTAAVRPPARARARPPRVVERSAARSLAGSAAASALARLAHPPGPGRLGAEGKRPSRGVRHTVLAGGGGPRLDAANPPAPMAASAIGSFRGLHTSDGSHGSHGSHGGEEGGPREAGWKRGKVSHGKRLRRRRRTWPRPGGREGESPGGRPAARSQSPCPARAGCPDTVSLSGARRQQGVGRVAGGGRPRALAPRGRGRVASRRRRARRSSEGSEGETSRRPPPRVRASPRARARARAARIERGGGRGSSRQREESRPWGRGGPCLARDRRTV